MIAFPDSLKARMAECGIIAVVTVEEPGIAVELAQVLIDSGINGIELTLRTPMAIDCLEAIVRKVPQMLVGAGTVITQQQVADVVAAGATFAVAPGCNPTVLAAASEHSLPFAPGIATPSDIEQAVMAGANILKYFPAETSGGMAHLKAISAPFAHLGLQFIPLGGLQVDNFTDYLRDPCCLAIGGSWLAPAALIRDRNWQAIHDNCKAAGAVLSKRTQQ